MKLTYKKVITNLIEQEIQNRVWKNAEKTASFDDGMILNADEDLIHFETTITVGHKEYIVNGAVDEYGVPFMSMITIKRMRCTEKDEKGEWITESAKQYTKLIYGEALAKFKFEE